MRPADQAWKHCLITGASSGIGAALAHALAGPGIRLALQGRDRTRLDALAEACRAEGALVETARLDVRDREALTAWIAAAAATAPLDLVIANAGIGGRPAREILAVNLEAVLTTVEAATAAMLPEGRGQIALMSSLAAFRGMATAPVYGASKAAVRLYGEGLRPRLAPKGIRVNVICPGFVATPMTADNPFPMPFLTTPEQAARTILEGLARNRARIAFPWPMYLAARLLAAWAADRLTANVAYKE